MNMSILMAAWIAVVLAVDIAVIRPWRSPAARAPLAIGFAFLLAAWVLGTGFVTFRDLMADGSWTAATLAMPIVPVKAIVLSLLAYAAGRTLLSARAGGDPKNWVLPVILTLVIGYAVVSDAINLHAGTLEKHAARSDLTPEDVAALAQRVRAGDAGRDEAYAFLANPRCPADLLAEQAASPDSYLRTAVASNETIDFALAEKLAADPVEQVRYYLAFNRKLPVALLKRFAADESALVREAVTWTEALPDEDFARLVDDPSPQVRAIVAQQARLSPAQIEKLRNDPEQRVRDATNRRHPAE